MTDPTKDFFIIFIIICGEVSFFLQSHETITALHPEEKTLSLRSAIKLKLFRFFQDVVCSSEQRK